MGLTLPTLHRHHRSLACLPLARGLRDTYFMITSDSLSTAFSSGLGEGQKKSIHRSVS